MNRSGCVAVLWLLTIGAPTRASIVAQDPQVPEAPAPAASDASDAPQPRVAPPAGYDAEEAFAKWAQAEFDRLTTEAQKAESPADRAVRLIEAANHFLAFGLVQDATTLVLGMKPAAASPADLAALDRVRSTLSEAESALSAAGEDPAAARLRSRWQTVTAFSMAFRAALTSEGESEEARRSAASALAPLSEDPDEGVAAAAALWQAVLRARESDLAPAMAILPMATADLKPGRETYEFFGKLLRCRLLGRESPGAALALLLQIEEQCHRWFEGEGERGLAIRATAWVRLTVLAEWCGKTEKPDALSMCRESAEEIRNEHFSAEAAVLPLAPAIPILKEKPDGADEAPTDDEDGEDDGHGEDGDGGE